MTVCEKQYNPWISCVQDPPEQFGLSVYLSVLGVLPFAGECWSEGKDQLA